MIASIFFIRAPPRRCRGWLLQTECRAQFTEQRTRGVYYRRRVQRLFQLMKSERMWIILAITVVGTVPYGLINVWAQAQPAAHLGTWIDDRIPFSKNWVFVYLSFELL